MYSIVTDVQADISYGSHIGIYWCTNSLRRCEHVSIQMISASF